MAPATSALPDNDLFSILGIGPRIITDWQHPSFLPMSGAHPPLIPQLIYHSVLGVILPYVILSQEYSIMNKQIAETLAGYARAAEYLEKERRERLAKITVEESRAIFDELV